MFLSVVVPCHNEEQSLGRLAEALGTVLPQVCTRFEVILVDDGSTDQTLPQMRRLAEQDARFTYLALSRNFGKESAMLAGLGRAAGDAVVIMDADLQHPPELLKSMIPLLEQGFDQVVARRSRDGEPFVRRSLSRMYYWFMNRMSDVKLQDGVGDFRVLSRRAVDALLGLQESNRFSKGLFAWIGFDTATVDYRNVERRDDASKWTLRKLFNYGIDGVVSFNSKPLRAIIHFGALVAVLGFVYVVWELCRTLLFGIESPGYLTLIGAVICLGGLQLLVLGVIGEYLGRIYHESKRRPHFVVKETSKQPVRDEVTLSETEAPVR
jgi:glycosyltransferase involved in cell wall biosynthesis